MVKRLIIRKNEMRQLVPQMYGICLNQFILFIRSISVVVPLKVSMLIHKIGPHNTDIISIIFGSLLGEGKAEKGKPGSGTKISFYQEGATPKVKYILFLHKFLSDKGYCDSKMPVVTRRLGDKGRILKVVRFSTWTYNSFNWIYDMWYVTKIKRVPKCIGQYLTPLVLAIWIMNNGSKVGKGLKITMNTITYKDCLLLVKALKDNYNLNTSVQLAGAKDQYVIYICKESMVDVRKIVQPYIIPEMKYKII